MTPVMIANPARRRNKAGQFVTTKAKQKRILGRGPRRKIPADARWMVGLKPGQKGKTPAGAKFEVMRDGTIFFPEAFEMSVGRWKRRRAAKKGQKSMAKRRKKGTTRKRKARGKDISAIYHSGARGYAAGMASFQKGRKRRRKSSGKRKHKRTRAAAPIRRRKRRRVVVSASPRKRRRTHARRAHGRKARRRSRKFVRVTRLYRRSNPGRLRLGNIARLVKLAAFGGLGIATARIGKFLYEKYASGFVRGDGSSKIRAVLDDMAKVAAMGGFTLVVNKAVARTRMVSPLNLQAHKIAGIAEAGRHGIGLVIGRVVPSLDKARYGLDGRMHGLEPRASFGELEAADSFAGVPEVVTIEEDYDDGAMGELESVDSFSGPFAASY